MHGILFKEERRLFKLIRYMFIFLFCFDPFVIRRIINSIITNMDSITNLHSITNMDSITEMESITNIHNITNIHRITNLHRTTNIDSIDNNDSFTITDFIIVINNWRLVIFQKLGFLWFQLASFQVICHPFLQRGLNLKSVGKTVSSSLIGVSEKRYCGSFHNWT